MCRSQAAFNRTLCISAIFTCIFYSCIVYADGGASDLYSKTIQEAKSGNMDFAFMHLRAILKNYPDSKYACDALFAEGEYFFSASDYHNASLIFSNVLDKCPDGKGVLFALMYLLKVAEIRQEESLIRKLKNEIINFKRLTFLFKETKDYKYKSLLLKKHRVVFHIDKIEFYVDGKLFKEIPY